MNDLQYIERYIGRPNHIGYKKFAVRFVVEKEFEDNIAAVQRIPAVPNILDIICQSTGMGFAAVARVTEDRWIACQVLDNVDFGLPAGGELKVETTLCHEIRQHRQVVAIDNVAEDPVYCKHHTPEIYGLQSYISVPIVLLDGRFFGTLCAIHTKPAEVNNPKTIGTFKLFAELIAHHLDAAEKLEEANAKLIDEQRTSELREQFVAVLGHDLRNPIAGVNAGINRLLRNGWNEQSPQLLLLMKSSMTRMSGLVDNVMDFARARLGGGIQLNLDGAKPIRETLDQVIEELRSAHPEREILPHYEAESQIAVNHERLAQMFSNLLANALVHGSPDAPIRVVATSRDEMFKLSVENTGNPIPEDARNRLFQPFQRGDTPHSHGLGLGLYIASQIAEAHGGTLTVSSDENFTRFVFSLNSR